MADGILLIDKPQGFTSFDVIAKLRGMSRQRKIGHAGTLDPMATGVLPCLFGSATRLCDVMPCDTKIYRAGVKFGVATDTQDMTGTIISESNAPVSREAAELLIPEFSGEIMQTPPMYSAVWVDGKRLYDLAREGKEVERPQRKINIFSLKLIEFDENERTATFDISCSRGTYIRTLFHDMGERLGCGAALYSLRRTYSNGFGEGECITMEQAQQLTDEGRLLEKLLPVHTAFSTLPKMNVGEWQGKMLSNGVALSLKKLGHPIDGSYAVWQGESFLGLGSVDTAADCMKLKKF